MQVRLSDHNSMSLRNRTTNKIYGRILVTGTDSDGSDQADQIADILQKTHIKTILRRGGKEIVLTQDKLALLCLLSAMNRPIFPTVIDYAHRFSTTYPLTNDYLFTEGTSKVFPVSIDLGCYVNLSGDDELILDVNCQAAQKSTVTNANLNLEFEEAVGVSNHVMCTRFESVPPGQNSWVKDLGSNVTKIALINLDIQSVDATASIISDIQVNSDKLQLSDTFYDLLLRRFTQSSDAETVKKSYNNFVIYHGTELDKVKLNFGLNGTAVAQGMNFVAHQFYVTDENLILKADGMVKKHQGRDMLKVFTSKHLVAHAKNVKTEGEEQQAAAVAAINNA